MNHNTTLNDDWIADLRRHAHTTRRARSNAAARGTAYVLLAVLAIVAVSYWAGYTGGRDDATLSIAKSCYLDNGFDADGIAFWCGDINDYADASTTPAPSTTLVNN